MQIEGSFAAAAAASLLLGHKATSLSVPPEILLWLAFSHWLISTQELTAISSPTLSFAASAKWNRGHSRRRPSLKGTVTSQCGAEGKSASAQLGCKKKRRLLLSLKTVFGQGFFFFGGVVYLTGCQSVSANTKRQSPCCDTENGFYSHVNVSTYKSHSFQ